MKGIRIEHAPGRPKPYLLVTTVDGKRRKTGYATQEEAESARAKATATHAKHGAPAVEWDAAAFREWKAAREILGDARVSLSEVALFWRDHGKRDCPRLPVPDAVEAYLEDKRSHNLSALHVEGVATRLGWFAADFAGFTVERVSSQDVVGWVRARGGAPRTQKNNRDAVVTFLNYAVRKGWTDKAPQIHESDLPKVQRGTKGIISPAECATLFATLAKTRPQFVAWFALQAFAGIRREEAGKLRWDFIDFKARKIVVPAVDPLTKQRICKTGDDWVMLGLPPNLWAWLEAVRHLPIRKASNDTRQKAEAAAGLKIPTNGLRHSFCTYHLSLNGSAEKTALLLRHTNTAQLWRSYFAGLKSKEEAAGYFAIVPQK